MSDVLARFEQKALEGISPSLPHTQGRLFRTGNNAIFHELSVQPIAGQRLLLQKLAKDPVLGLFERVKNDGTKEVYWGTRKTLYRYNSVDGVDVMGTSYTGSNTATAKRRPHLWSMVSWGDWVLASNGKDQVQIDKTGAGFVNLAGTNFTYAEILATMGDFVLALNTSRGAKLVQWCDADIPELWTPADDNVAGEMYLRELESDIIAACALGTVLAVHGSDSIMAIVPSGDFAFVRRHLVSGAGVVGKFAVCSIGALNFGMSYRNLWMSDGAKVVYIDDPEIHDEVFNNLNLEQVSKVVVWYDKLYDSVWYFYPSLNSTKNDRAVIYNRQLQNWSKVDFGRSAAIEAGVFPFGITADELGNVYAQSALGSLQTVDVVPVQVTPTVTLTQAYGQGGYGQGGYGGSTTSDG